MKPHEPCTNTSQLEVASMATRDTAVLSRRTPSPLLKSCPSLYCHMGLSHPRYWTLTFWPACWGASEKQPCPPACQPPLQPGVIQGGLWLPLVSSNTSFHAFQKEKSPTSASFCLFMKPDWSHTNGIVTKWNKKVCVTETDYCETALMKLRKENWRGGLFQYSCVLRTHR